MRVSRPYHFLKINELYEEIVNCTTKYFYTSRSLEQSKRTLACQLYFKNLWWAQARRQSSVFGGAHFENYTDGRCIKNILRNC